MIRKRVNYLAILTLIFIISAAGCTKYIMNNEVNLEPNDPRPISSIEVSDPHEADLLVQELGLEIIKTDGATLYFYENKEQLARLRQLAYEPNKSNPYDVFRRVVRIDRSVPQKQLSALGVRVINREPDYFVIEGKLSALRSLVRGGSAITAVGGHEPRPRQVRIIVENHADVQQVNALGVDIYSAKPVNDYSDQRHKGRNIVIYGGAFDYEIDQLTEAGYAVETLPEPTANSGEGQ